MKDVTNRPKKIIMVIEGERVSTELHNLKKEEALRIMAFSFNVLKNEKDDAESEGAPTVIDVEVEEDSIFH